MKPVVFFVILLLLMACEDTANSNEEVDNESDGTQMEVAAVPSSLPTVTGDCPFFEEGEVTFNPSGLNTTRVARIWIGDQSKTMDGPLVFYWHGTQGDWQETLEGLNADIIDEIKSIGGIVVAPQKDPAAGLFPWYLVTGDDEDDLVLADEIIACAMEEVGIDTHRIHTIGWSAGGLHSSQMSLRRSNYMASAVIYSGGFRTTGIPEFADSTNKFSAMVFHGGTDDTAIIGFQATSETYVEVLQENGNFAAICDHGLGHAIPENDVEHAWKFLKNHPFGTYPSPYASERPSDFPAYCQ